VHAPKFPTTHSQELCTDRDAVWGVDSGWSRMYVLDGAQIPMHANGKLLREMTSPGMPDDILPSAVQTWLKRSISRFGCGLQSYSRGCANVPSWQIGLNRSSAAAMWPYVKLV